MANMVTNIFKIPDLRRRIFFTIFCLVIYRIGCHLVVPGIDPVGLQNLIEQLQSQALGSILAYADLFVGGALERFTIFALGIMPYISASIIIQLLTTTIPKLEQLSREGDQGRRVIQRYTRYLTIAICLVQSLLISRWMSSSANINVITSELQGNQILFILLSVATITTGTVFLMWLGDQITERGIGNGISLLIFAGIVARAPGAFLTIVEKTRSGDLAPVSILALLVIFSIVVFFVVYEQQGQRRVPIQFSKKIVGRKMYGGQSNYIPFKINPTGVIPIIFASAVVMIPTFIAQSLGNQFPNFAVVVKYFSPGHVPYMLIYSILIILFAFVMTRLQFNPIDIANNLKRSGGYVPGIRPGESTREYLQLILTRISLLGSIFLALVAILPDILINIGVFKNIPQQFIYLMGGTSLLIIVAVDLDTMKQIESQMVMNEYDGFMSKTKRNNRRR